MSDLEAAAAALNAPEALVQRSAEARASATGSSVDEILAAWAGGGTAPAAAAPAAEEPTAADTTADDDAEPAAAEPAAAEPAPDEAAPATPPPDQTPAQPAAAVTRPPTPERVSPVEALDYPVVVTVPTANLKERTGGSLPRWLVAVLMVVPAFGLLYLSSALDAGAASCEPDQLVLAVDRSSGDLENCDGTAFEGRGGAAGEAGAFIVAGGDAYRSAAINCAGCHGPNGGGGSGPALTNVDVTFSSCEAHVEWVRLGSAGAQAAGQSTYGDTGNPIAGGMPGFASLSEEELRSVVAFERISFAGAPAEETLVDCGLVEAEGEETGEEDGEPADPATDTAETGGDAEVEGGDIPEETPEDAPAP